MNKHIIYITDMNMGGSDSAEKAVPRSGYANIGIELCRELDKLGNKVIILGLGYTGQEHNNNFSIVPCASLQDVVGYVNNIKYMLEMMTGKGVDVVITALDIHHFQEQIFPAVKKLELPYICITPLESDPLCITWANLLMQMDKVFFISQLGEDEAKKAGVEAEHIEIGIDTNSWRLRTEEEYKRVRETFGYTDDDFVVLTVADNQERKDLSGGFEVIAKLKELGASAKHILVTREHSMVGWKLWDMAYGLDISSDVRILPNGMPFSELYMLYCAADAYMSCSKGEGLGLPIMEAMSVGIPVVANSTGALTELLSGDRGWLVPSVFKHIDPFGNQTRYYVDRDKMAEILHEVKKLYNKETLYAASEITRRTLLARKYMESRTWDKPARQIEEAIGKLSGT